MRRFWRLFSSIFTVAGLIVLVLYNAPLPFFDHNNATLVATSERAQRATARALATSLGNPGVELNTADLHRYLFSDGTSADVLVHPTRFQSYQIVALKSVVLGLFSTDTPMARALAMIESLRQDGFDSQIVPQPDSAFPPGATVLVLSEAFRCGPDYGFGVIIRKHAFRVGGQTPTSFKGWQPR